MHAQTRHEMCHQDYTDPKVFKAFQDELERIGREVGLVTSQQTKNLWNSLEDGMIEERERTTNPRSYQFLSARNRIDPKVGGIEITDEEREVPYPGFAPVINGKTLEVKALTDEQGNPVLDKNGKPIQLVVIPKGTRMQAWGKKPISLVYQAQAAILAAALPEYEVGELHPTVAKAMKECQPHIDAAVRGNTADCITRAMKIRDILAKYGIEDPETMDPEQQKKLQQMAQQAMQMMMQMPSGPQILKQNGGGQGQLNPLDPNQMPQMGQGMQIMVQMPDPNQQGQQGQQGDQQQQGGQQGEGQEDGQQGQQSGQEQGGQQGGQQKNQQGGGRPGTKCPVCGIVHTGDHEHKQQGGQQGQEGGQEGQGQQGQEGGQEGQGQQGGQQGQQGGGQQGGQQSGGQQGSGQEGQGAGQGQGKDGQGQGEGSGEGAGQGQGKDGKDGGGQGSGDGQGQGAGQGQGKDGQAQGSGEGAGQGGKDGQGQGQGSGQGQGKDGQGEGEGQGAGQGQGKGGKDGKGQGAGKEGKDGDAQGTGQGQGKDGKDGEGQGAGQGQGKDGKDGQGEGAGGQTPGQESGGSSSGGQQGMSMPGGGDADGSQTMPGTDGQMGPGGFGATGGYNPERTSLAQSLPVGQREENDRTGRGQAKQEDVDKLLAKTEHDLKDDKLEAKRLEHDIQTQAARRGRFEGDSWETPGDNRITSQKELRAATRAHGGATIEPGVHNYGRQLAQELRNLNAEFRRPMTGRRRGRRIDPRKYSAALAGRQDVMENPGLKQDQHCRLDVVVDRSGSVHQVQSNNRGQQTMAMMFGYMDREARGRLPTSIYGYDGGWSNTGHYAYKEAHSQDLSSIPSLLATGGGGTPTADGVEFSRARLARSKEEIKIMAVVTDGGANDIPATREQVDQARREGIVVVGLAFECDPGQMNEQFGIGNWAPISDYKRAPRIVGKLISDAAARNRGRRSAG